MLTKQEKEDAYNRVYAIISNLHLCNSPSTNDQSCLQALKKVTECMSSYPWELSDISDVLTPYRNLAEIAGGNVYGSFMNGDKQTEFKDARTMHFSCTCLGHLCSAIVEDIIKVFSLDRKSVQVEVDEQGDCRAVYVLK